MKLYIIGMPGAGKTTLGQALAAHYELPFVDLDAEIVAQAGQEITAIFSQYGEAYFRQLEADTLRQLVARPEPLVLATGGGTPCFHANMEVLNQTGFTFWLDVPLPVLAARLAAASPQRPLLAAAATPEAWLHETLRARARFYGQARLRCLAECTAPEVAAQLSEAGFASGRSD